MKCMYCSIKFCYSDILLKKKSINFIYNHLFCCNHTCYCVNMFFVMPASCYITSASRFQSRSSMYIRGLIPRNFAELTEAVPIVGGGVARVRSLFCFAVLSVIFSFESILMGKRELFV